MAGRLRNAIVLGLGMAAAIPAWAAELVSVGLGGAPADGDSVEPALSRDGRFVAFRSSAGNLVPGDTDAAQDIFVRDRKAKATALVSVGLNGAPPDGDSLYAPAISADGRFVAFCSMADNLVSGDTNGKRDIFVRDLQAGTTTRVNLGPGGVQANQNSARPAISADGRFVAFESFASNLVAGDRNVLSDIFVHDRQTGLTERVSLGPGDTEANDHSVEAAISGDGRFVAYVSLAGNLVAGDTNGPGNDVFLRDRTAGTTTRINLGPGGAQADKTSYPPAISGDGRYVVFQSGATNLVSGDTNNRSDIFAYDRKAGKLARLSLGPGGVQANGFSAGGSISSGGRFVAFESDADNLVKGDGNDQPDIFVRDRKTSRTARTGLGPKGRQADAESFDAVISPDGGTIAFSSLATNLLSRKNGSGVANVFVTSR